MPIHLLRDGSEIKSQRAWGLVFSAAPHIVFSSYGKYPLYQNSSGLLEAPSLGASNDDVISGIAAMAGPWSGWSRIFEGLRATADF